MNFWRSITTILVFFISATAYSTMALASDCDWCVCKGRDTVNSCTSCCSSAKNFPNAITESELRIANDGKAIVDQNGREVARFVEGIRMRTQMIKGQGQKLQGCMRCRNECVIYEGERCVKSIRTCEWDFDCNTSSGALLRKVKVEKSTDTPKIIERELTPDTGEYMRTPCYKTERYCTEWLSDGKCKLWDSRQVQVPC